MSEPQAYQDGPNTHHYRTLTRGTSFHVVTVDYADGDRHTFHVPSEVVNVLDAARDTASHPLDGAALREALRATWSRPPDWLVDPGLAPGMLARADLAWQQLAAAIAREYAAALGRSGSGGGRG